MCVRRTPVLCLCETAQVKTLEVCLLPSCRCPVLGAFPPGQTSLDFLDLRMTQPESSTGWRDDLVQMMTAWMKTQAEAFAVCVLSLGQPIEAFQKGIVPHALQLL